MRYFFLGWLLLLITPAVSTQGIDFFHGSWEEAQAEAARQDKLIFIDAYASWCGPCKRMAKTVFTDPAVGEFFNQNFINLKLDMEQPESATFRRLHAVRAFPTLFFVRADGEAVSRVQGALDADRFLEVAQGALTQAEPVEDYAERYAQGERDPAFIYKYVRALVRSGQPHLRITNDYLRDQHDLSTETNLQLLLLAATEADSRVFDLLVTQRAAAAKLLGAQLVSDQLLAAGHASVAKAAAYSTPELLERVIGKIEQQLPDRATNFRAGAELYYYRETRDEANYLRVATDYSKKVLSKDDSDGLLKLAEESFTAFRGSEKILDLAERLAHDAARRGDDARYHFAYASLLHQRGKTQQAYQAADEAKRRATEQSNQMLIQQINRLLQLIEAAG